jgi:hypothetical protein
MGMITMLRCHVKYFIYKLFTTLAGRGALYQAEVL